MGSMPEGRKCVTCIGKKIEESKRSCLGKCSRMLNELEIQQAMNSEKTCMSNQLPPELIVVNGEPLSQDELHVLLTCRNRPKKLKPGFYWYDKVSGLWGKEGHGPCQIITAQINVGGKIKAHASNGNAKVIVNDREITRNELWMLQIVGVNCEGKPSFWLSADGSYQEGDIVIFPNVMSLAITWMLYMYLIFRQEFSFFALSSLATGSASQIYHKSEYSISPQLKAFSEWLIQVMESGNLEVIFPDATSDYAQFFQKLWNDAGFQATYNQRHELETLPGAATYFLERAVEISKTDYEPSDMDILYAEVVELIILHGILISHIR
ncbi:Extra-large guanine nucleotide-binding protein 2 [Hibiscus syriacus]|uniref:Extra-large guanine nucleotide-binding protein 2 n=1 Tax=Hibiscus syriacus TaxID=106335 RepID=A0A6A3CI93_HIBSY|nr:Extra-large guanine nucleotide-binding protein 2 [Hibiscus syriacus]